MTTPKPIIGRPIQLSCDLNDNPAPEGRAYAEAEGLPDL